MNPNAPKQVTVTVITDNHTHAGQPVAKGAELAVDEATASWLIANKIALASGGAIGAGTEAAAGKDKKESK